MRGPVLVSLVVPVYNVADTIEACLASALDVLPGDCEIVCVDDGCTDDSIERVRRLLDRYPQARARVRIVSQTNQGLSGARNKGITEAVGRYIGLLDSDDLLGARYFMAIRDVVDRYPDVSIIGFNAETFETESSGHIRRRFLPVHAGSADIVAGADDRVALLAAHFARGRWFAWARVYDRRLFEIERFSLGFKYQDMLLLPELYRRASRIVHIDDVLIRYRIHAASVTAAPDLVTFACLDAIIDRYRRRSPDLPPALDSLRHLVVLSAIESVFHARRRQAGSLAAGRALRARQRQLGRGYIARVLARYGRDLRTRSLLLHTSPLVFAGMGYSKRLFVCLRGAGK